MQRNGYKLPLRKRNVVRYLIILTALYSSSLLASNNVVIEPFGTNTYSLPARSNVLEVADLKVDLKSQQVCGYTDWSTTMITLPKQLVSKEYWQGIAKNLKAQAIKVIFDLAHALPSKIACDLVPNHCSLMNHNEVMAAFEGQLTFDTCEILEEIGTNNVTTNESFALCIQNMKKVGHNVHEAREKCLTDGLNDPRDQSPGKQVDSMVRLNEKSGKSSMFDFDDYILSLFPGEVQSKGGSEIDLQSGPYSYSRLKKVKKFATQLFTGISLEGSTIVSRGGTFFPSFDKDIQNENKKLTDEIMIVLKRMKELKDKGMTAERVIATVAKDPKFTPKSWEKSKTVHPFFRPSSGATEPTQILELRQVYRMLPAYEETMENSVSLSLSEGAIGQPLADIINRISKPITFIKTKDVITDLYFRLLSQCASEIKLQNERAQESCDASLRKVRAQRELLDLTIATENSAIEAQEKVNSILREISDYRANKLLTDPVDRTKKTTKIIVPGS